MESFTGNKDITTELKVSAFSAARINGCWPSKLAAPFEMVMADSSPRVSLADLAGPAEQHPAGSKGDQKEPAYLPGRRSGWQNGFTTRSQVIEAQAHTGQGQPGK